MGQPVRGGVCSSKHGGGDLGMWRGLAVVSAGDSAGSDKLGIISRVAEERG